MIFLRKQILFYAIQYNGEYYQIKRAIERNEKWEEIKYEGKYLTILDDHYPKVLFELEEPPLILFYEGNLELLLLPMVSMIGSRECSKFASTSCRNVIHSFKKKKVIVSGLAKGIDSLAHLEAIQMGCSCIGVIGCGLDVIYPKSNHELYEVIKKEHLLLSEYPFGVQPMAHHFPMRNRIIAALGEKCYVIEAKSKSGTMITANYALSMNREIIALPYRYDDEFGKGCNELIEQGASIFMVDDENY